MNEHDEIRARYRMAMGCKKSDNLTETGKKIFAALADIPRLLGEVERLNVEEQLYRLSYQGLLLELNKALELENQLPSELLKHIATIRTQLAKKSDEAAKHYDRALELARKLQSLDAQAYNEINDLKDQLAKKLDPSRADHRRAFVKAIADGEFGQLHLRQLVDIVLQHLKDTDQLRCLVDYAIRMERNLTNGAE